MGTLRYTLYYATSYATLQCIDAWLNYHRSVNGFEESLNPLSNTPSFASLILEPLNVAIVCFCSSMIFMMERNRKRTAELMRSEWGALLGTPYVLLGLKLLAVLDSTVHYAGFGSPVSSMRIFGDNQMLSIIFLFIAVAIALHLPVTNYLRKRYLDT